MNNTQIPEQGQLIKARNRFYIVQDVEVYVNPDTQQPSHKLTLECVDDVKLGETVELIFELEAIRKEDIFTDIGFPSPEKWDPLSRFEAFYHAINWSCSSFVAGPPLQSPFMGAIEIEDYQFEPVVRALNMPRVNLLIADDVGLGKTIEAGLVVQELLARNRIRRIMIVCPASLMNQWRDEMMEKFNLEFRIIDREAIHKLRKEYGNRVNPWNSFPRLITSMDFIKREMHLRSFINSLKSKNNGSGLRDWDMLILDEAHNTAPSGRKNYIRDSDRTIMVREITPQFENRLFLTATPHNGYTYSFTALLEMLDPLRFSRGPTIDKDQRDLVMIRRMKEDIISDRASRNFAKRIVEKITIDLPPDDNHPERVLFKYLDLYRESRLERAKQDKNIMPIKFALTLLKKRLLSCPLAFFNSLEVHLDNITKPGYTIPDEKKADEVLFENLHHKTSEDWDDDEEKAQCEEQALQESSKFFGQITEDEDKYLTALWDISSKLKERADAKANELIEWVEKNLLLDGKWKDDRLLIFTEYKDTLEYLESILNKYDDGNRILKLYGGMNQNDRNLIKASFQAHPMEDPVRILLATDAASEGLNLQNHCRFLIHYEIPWNPNKMEQRNGRIDRHGQKFPEVFCHHFYYSNHEDSRFLQVIIDKMQQQRADMGGIGELIEREVERKMLGEKDINYYDNRLNLVRAETRAYVKFKEEVRGVRTKIDVSRSVLNITPEIMKMVVEQGLSLSLGRPFKLAEINLNGNKPAFILRENDIPRDWTEVRETLRDKKGRVKPIIFNAEYLKEHKHVSLIHLNHPLLKRAVGVFRANMWLVDRSSHIDLNRISFKVIPNGVLQQPHVVGISRLVVTNHWGQKLHEELINTGGPFQESLLNLEGPDALKNILKLEGNSIQIPSVYADKLRTWFPNHKQIMEYAMVEIKKKEEKRVTELLKEKSQKESAQIRKLVRDRIKEIQKRIEEAGKEKLQLELNFEEEQQYEDDIKWLERRLGQLKAELVQKPEQVKEQYKVKHTQVYPIGMIYVLPESVVA